MRYREIFYTVFVVTGGGAVLFSSLIMFYCWFKPEGRISKRNIVGLKDSDAL
jgi:hypothetical protein